MGWQLPAPRIPRYGEASLAEVVPSVLAAVGVEGFGNILGIQPFDSVCLFVVDGLGWEQLLEFGADARFLAGLAVGLDGGRPVTAGFPATTAASLGSHGTRQPPGEPGRVGYTFAVPGRDRPMNALLWSLYGIGPSVDLRAEVVPERFQPAPTVLERAAVAGTTITLVGPADHAGSGLTRAILRGGRYVGVDTTEGLVEEAVTAASAGPRSSAYVYYPFLDTNGHIYGVGSDEWLAQLRFVDGMASSIYGRLPQGAALVVTSDHGTINLGPDDRLDVADRPELMAGVRMLAGEARARHVYARAGTAEDVLAVWRDVVGERMWVASRDQAIADGWFGPVVRDHVRDRIGDVVAASADTFGVFQREIDPLQGSLVGHHGSMLPAEQLAPLLIARR